MDNKRLQAYKIAIGIGIEAGCGFEVAPNDMQEFMDIITALEACQQQLVNVDNTRKYWLKKSEDKTIIIADLRTQLATSQAEVVDLEGTLMLNQSDDCANVIATDDGFLITVDKRKL